MNIEVEVAQVKDPEMIEGDRQPGEVQVVFPDPEVERVLLPMIVKADQAEGEGQQLVKPPDILEVEEIETYPMCPGGVVRLDSQSLTEMYRPDPLLEAIDRGRLSLAPSLVLIPGGTVETIDGLVACLPDGHSPA